ncbi:ras guanine nucleotide exchange factor glfB [Bactrocera dorsalis]|uniref:Ras guanine nucleotide exchange factor glfB n=1 Tax=Bactrocera dorsalis TaxID=27457 RepID=A0A6I9V683_BACDO|nr:ras guanine nucleotide exchange factor glfB [Bactrocera dorsalis]
MEATPKVHRHRHRRSDSRHHRHERQSQNSSSNSNNSNNSNNTNGGSGSGSRSGQQPRQSNNIATTTTATTIVSTPTQAADALTNTTTSATVASRTRTQHDAPAEQLQLSPTQQQTHSNAIQSPVRERRGQARSNRAQTGAQGLAANATATTAARRTSITSIEIPTALVVEDGNEDGTYDETTAICANVIVTTVHERRTHSMDTLDPLGQTTSLSQSTTSQQTVLLVNGHSPPPQEDEEQAPIATGENGAMLACGTNADVGGVSSKEEGATQLESPTAPNPNGGGAGSSRNSSGDALSLRETLQQLPPTVTHGHRHRRTHSPQSPARRTQEVDASFHRGILGFMDRELKHSSPTPSALSVGSGSAASGGGGGGAGGSGTVRKLQSLSDPQASPAQRSVRSRSSLEKSPRRKRSKSESRRRRERKLIAAGELEVRQANETLMRYLKQCSEMNDASLSGELEIDQNYDERRVHRKTKSQRDKRGHLISKLYSAGGLTSILRELSDDIVPAEGEEIYNPFTPVVSPTEDTPAHIDKMFLQTSSGYRPVEHCYYKHSFVGVGGVGGGGATASGSGGPGGGGGSGRGVGVHRLSAAGGSLAGGLEQAGMLRASSSFGDTRCLLDAECGRHRREITSNIQLACVIQRIWILISNICHGLLAGLALAHLLFVLSSHPVDWSRLLSLAGETVTQATQEADATTAAPTVASAMLDADGVGAVDKSMLTDTQQHFSFVKDYATFAEIYLNTFYCLAIVCMVSVFDRMDICRWDFSNATEFISFRWLIIAMIYIATIILTICSDSIDERLYYNNNANVTLTQEEMYSNSVLSVWSSLSVTRSIGAICGWIMIGLTPHEDLFYEHLLDLTKYQVINN